MELLRMEFLGCFIQMDLWNLVTYGNGKPVTNWLYFDENGKKESVKIYENGTFIYEKYIK